MTDKNEITLYQPDEAIRLEVCLVDMMALGNFNCHRLQTGGKN